MKKRVLPNLLSYINAKLNNSETPSYFSLLSAMLYIPETIGKILETYWRENIR